MRRALAAFVNMYVMYVDMYVKLFNRIFGKDANRQEHVDPTVQPPRLLHPRLLAALLGVPRIDRRKTWEHCDRQASQIREGYQEVETLCGQVCLSARDIFRYPHLDVLGFTGRSHEILVDMFGIRLDRAASSGPLHLKYDAKGADPSDIVSLDRQVLDQSLVTKMVVTYGNKPAVEADMAALELLLQRGEVQEFGICADGVTHFVVLQRGEIEVVICSRG